MEQFWEQNQELKKFQPTREPGYKKNTIVFENILFSVLKKYFIVSTGFFVIDFPLVF